MALQKTENYSTLEEVIKALGDPNAVGASMTWIGKNYSKKDLIDDLIKIKECQCT
jgi:hypothetical protein